MATTVFTTTFPLENTTSSFNDIELPTSILVCTYVSCSLSICGAITIFVTYCTVPQAKNQTRRLLLYLTIADLMSSSGNLMGAIRYSVKHRHHRLLTDEDILEHCHHPGNICTVQSLITTFSSLASFSWTIIIGLHILLTLVYQSEWCMTTISKVLAHCVSWGLPCK